MYFACLKYASVVIGRCTENKLAKLLYLADFTNFYKELEPMSGVKYRRMEYGPVADVFFSLTEACMKVEKLILRQRTQLLLYRQNHP